MYPRVTTYYVHGHVVAPVLEVEHSHRLTKQKKATKTEKTTTTRRSWTVLVPWYHVYSCSGVNDEDTSN